MSRDVDLAISETTLGNSPWEKNRLEKRFDTESQFRLRLATYRGRQRGKKTRCCTAAYGEDVSYWTTATPNKKGISTRSESKLHRNST